MIARSERSGDALAVSDSWSPATVSSHRIWETTLRSISIVSSRVSTSITSSVIRFSRHRITSPLVATIKCVGGLFFRIRGTVNNRSRFN